MVAPFTVRLPVPLALPLNVAWPLPVIVPLLERVIDMAEVNPRHERPAFRR